MYQKLIEIAELTIVSINNFIHGIDHIARVRDLANYISSNIDEDLSWDEKKALEIAVYWHDIGRIDMQKYSKDYEHAVNSVESLYNVAERFDMENDNAIKLAISAIRNHSRKDSKISRDLIVDRILWDADKMDIFNVRRVNRIVNYYKQNGNVGEYSLEDSLQFWNTIDEEFANNFYFEITKKMFREEYPKFKETINMLGKEVL